MTFKLPQSTKVTSIICTAEILAMVGVFTFPALLPIFTNEWALTAVEAGWINGIYFGGYLIAVPILVSLTDYFPPQRIYLFAVLFLTISSAGFAFVADGFWEAMFFRGLGGIGLAGTYMPGLKLLTDSLEREKLILDNSRSIAFYTTSFGLGGALSYFLAGELSLEWGWRVAFGAAAVGPIVSGFVIFSFFRGFSQDINNVPETKFLDFRPVLKCKETMGYVLAYTVHNFELFAFRSWMVAFLVYSASTHTNQTLIFSATVWATISNLIGLPFSILGNELSKKIGRHRAITIIMWSSAICALGIGFAAELPFLLVVTIILIYGVLITAESPSLTAGVINSAPSRYRGSTMAVYSCIGFVGSFAGPVIFGLILDVTSNSEVGGQTTESWGWAFLITGLVVASGPLFLFFFKSNQLVK